MCLFDTACRLCLVPNGGVRALDDVLREARNLQLAAARVGFDWPDVQGAMSKLREEADELGVAIIRGNAAEIREELGDLLFSAVNVSRFAAVDAADALRAANEKFDTRFTRLREELARRGRRLGDCSLEELDSVWNVVKG